MRGGRGCWIYNIARVFLLLVTVAGGMLILVSLAYGQVPAWHDFDKGDFLVSFLGASFLIITQTGVIALIYFARNISKRNPGKIILFFLAIGVAAAMLIAIICLVAFS